MSKVIHTIPTKQVNRAETRPFGFLRMVKLITTCTGMLLGAAHVYAGQTTLAWDANTDPAVAGYMVYYGQNSGNYSGKADAGNKASYTVAALMDGRTYYYAVTAYDASRAESGFSNEASSTISTSGSASVATPTGGNSATGGGGGGGGCVVGVGGTGAPMDPTFPALLLAAGFFLVSRKKFYNSASARSNFSRPSGRK